MDSEAASSGSMSKKKTPKGAFHGPAGVILGNIKHSGDERNISLKFGSGYSVFSDVESLSDNENENDIDMSGGGNGSLLGLAVNTPRTNRLSTGMDFGSSLSSPNFAMDEKINGFGRATTSSKFKEIIQSTFTSEKSMRKAASLAEKERIIVNNNVKKQGLRSNWTVVIKEISMNTPKDIIIAAVSEFGIIKSIKIQLVGMWQKAVVEFANSDQAVQLASRWSFLIGKDSVHVAMAMGDHDTWASRDQFRALLFTLPISTIVHDLSMLLDGAGRKTCVINRSLETGNQFCCAVVCFESDEMLESVFYTKPIFGGIRLLWARLELVWCSRCGHFGHSALECDASDVSPFVPSNLMKKSSFGASCFQLAKLYTRKNVPISCPTAFGGKSWAQVVSFASLPGGSPSGSGLLSNAPVVDSGMALDDVLASSAPSLSGGSDSAAVLSSSGLKVLTSKLGGLESKMSGLKALFSSILLKDKVYPWLASKFDGVRVFSFRLNSDYVGAGVVVIMNNSLAKHVSKVSEIPDHLLCIRLLFKNKLLVSVLGLYAGVSLTAWFSQAGEINFLIAMAVNESSFVILGGDFNENGSHKCASFKRCFDLGLVNSLNGSPFVKAPTWCNFCGVTKMIDYVFISSDLVGALVDYGVVGVKKFFDTDHKAVSVSVGLDGCLDV
ncbi:hypothetical protein G9A89_016701 [Geosiphon pyriformis]|nr:hypothetical protein G9A89_016701 [Geosiphon pyriformis]